MKFKRLKRMIRLISFFSQNPVYHYLRFVFNQQAMVKTIKKFNQEDKINTLKPLMRNAVVKYHWNFEEFFLFDYQGLTTEQRKLFCPEYEKNVFCDKVNNYKSAEIFDDKWQTYLYFRNFFKRDVHNIPNLNIINKENKELFEFVSKNKRFIAKPVYNAFGRDIKILSANNPDEALRLIKDVFIKSGKLIIEELIKQVPEMACFHPESINTVRVPTVNFGNTVEVIHPILRMGRGLSIVDNTGAGGIFGIIDIKTGIVIAACDNMGINYTSHPDTGQKIEGFQIPHWKDAIETAKILANVLPDVKYVGWDLALTHDGWVLVEGNDKGQFGFQYLQKKGFMPELKDIYSRLNS